MNRDSNKEQRTCFNCKHSPICYFKTAISLINWRFNIDGDAAPGQWHEIYMAIGNACLQYEPFEQIKSKNK